MSDEEILAKTIWAEARGELVEGQREVARVILERAAQNRSYFGGNTIRGVCLAPRQFECWNGVTDIDVSSDRRSYSKIRKWSDHMCRQTLRSDPNAPDHYNNPEKEGYPDWTRNCAKLYRIGNHQFYRCN